MVDFIYKAKLAEQAERYDDMFQIIKKAIQQANWISPELRNLLSVSYKNVLGKRRIAIRAAWNFELNKKTQGNLMQAEIARKYRFMIEEEIDMIRQEMLCLISYILEYKPHTEESRIVFLKMKGDYCNSKNKTLEVEAAEEAYEEAMKLSIDLPTYHPVRLGLALSFSVFLYEIRKQASGAWNIAKTAYDQEYAEISNLDEKKYKDATIIMQLIRENICLWDRELIED